MKKLMFPQEFDVWYLFPAIRKKLALKLLEKGLLQKEVASIMNISAATITHYKKDQRVKNDLLGYEFDELIDQAVIKIVEDNSLVPSEILLINQHFKKQDSYCKLFQQFSGQELSSLPCGNCNNESICK